MTKYTTVKAGNIIWYTIILISNIYVMWKIYQYYILNINDIMDNYIFVISLFIDSLFVMYLLAKSALIDDEDLKL